MSHKKPYKPGRSIFWAQEETLDGCPVIHESASNKDFTLDVKYSLVSPKTLSFSKNMCYMGTFSTQSRMEIQDSWGTGNYSWSVPVNTQIDSNSKRLYLTQDHNSVLIYRKDKEQ